MILLAGRTRIIQLNDAVGISDRIVLLSAFAITHMDFATWNMVS
jgi:hypothetical protein